MSKNVVISTKYIALVDKPSTAKYLFVIGFLVLVTHGEEVVYLANYFAVFKHSSNLGMTYLKNIKNLHSWF